MKNSNPYRHFLSIFLVMGIAPFLCSCDETPNPDKAESGKESIEKKALIETAEEAEGVEAAKEAIKKKDEQEEKESDTRKEKQEETKSASAGAGRASQGLFKRK